LTLHFIQIPDLLQEIFNFYKLVSQDSCFWHWCHAWRHWVLINKQNVSKGKLV